ncbi:efflux RND transporter periplasmic adaptor subunit [Corallococcus macrosporus]|uniref:Efflux RND transporter periplasmic adaptor subunit n=1 Tax=Corallococcus macrosporus TaxID=35 RepID=A0ABS3DGI7_9BACT|nr:efflux RND transporter periplasmic adaptor subunit [Corallococcus macrosporus]MBN8230433.1 efflux RND transporter periplasmic adaptor subunit [Corallococcus macrosporus]
MKALSEMPREAPALAPVELEEDEGRKRGVPRWAWILAILVVAGAGVFWRMRAGSDADAVTYDTTPAEARKLMAKVTATGTVAALVTVQVGSQVSGRIQELMVDYNSQVKKGQVIARIDPQLVQAALDRAKANMTAARANLQKARVNADVAKKQAVRSKELRAQQFISQSELETAESAAANGQAEVTAAEGSVAQAQAALNEAEVNLKYTTIVSPTDGIVISRSVDVGQTVAASLQAPVLFTIAEDLRKMQVNTSIAEADVGKLQPGMKATFTVDAFPGETFNGVIRQIRNEAITVQNVVTYLAVIDVPNPDLKLKPGMTANVTIVTQQKDQALSVPNTALRYRPVPSPNAPTPAQPAPAGMRTVYVLRRQPEQKPQPVAVNVRTGMTDGTFTEVVEGELKAGDRVITAANSPAGATPSSPAPSGASPLGGGGGRGMGGGRRGGF